MEEKRPGVSPLKPHQEPFFKKVLGTPKTFLKRKEETYFRKVLVELFQKLAPSRERSLVALRRA